MTPDLDTTIEIALRDSERASIAAAKEAYERGDIAQREVAPGVFKLGREDYMDQSREMRGHLSGARGGDGASI